MGISQEAFEAAAKALDLEGTAEIRAVADIESRGTGFNDDGSLVTLFEGHVFHRLTGGKYDEQYPDISYPNWDRTRYGRTLAAEQMRLARARNIDNEAALRATSMGMFQIMGFNYRRCGFSDALSMYETMRRSEDAQLHAFVAFIKNDAGLWKCLRDRNWTSFARFYNGPSYAKNAYDTKLAIAYQRFANEEA